MEFRHRVLKELSCRIVRHLPVVVEEAALELDVRSIEFICGESQNARMLCCAVPISTSEARDDCGALPQFRVPSQHPRQRVRAPLRKSLKPRAPPERLDGDLVSMAQVIEKDSVHALTSR